VPPPGCAFGKYKARPTVELAQGRGLLLLLLLLALALVLHFVV
jgi:hypothetical protein